MQAMAPSSRSAPQEGHFFGPPAFAAAVGGGRVIDGLDAGRGGGAVAAGAAAAAAGRGGAAAAAPAAARTPELVPAAAGWGALIRKTVEHFGQRTCFPAEPSGTCMACVQLGQLMICGMVGFLEPGLPRTQTGLRRLVPRSGRAS